MRRGKSGEDVQRESPRRVWRIAPGLKVLFVAVIVLGLASIARHLPIAPMVEALSGWVKGLGVWGPVVYGLIYVVAVVAILPASALSVAAGAIFGPVLGMIVVSLSSTTGAALAFLIARHLARDAVTRRVQRYPRFEAIDRAIGSGGWKIVAMLRLSPAVPFNLQNYLYGLTRIGFWPCVITSWIAMMPGTFMYVYFGYAGRAGLQAASGEGTRSPAEWALLGVGLAATIVVTVYVTRLARKAMREQADMDPAETTGRAAVLDATVLELPRLDHVLTPQDFSVSKNQQPRHVENVEPKPLLSIVIPTWNESARIAATIASARREGVEMIVVDGGSSDSTTEIALRHGARVVPSSRGRGPQLNAGAAAARGDHLLFLHADTTLPDGYLDAVQEILIAPGVALGAFRLRIDRPGLLIRVIEFAVRVRCALMAMPYGDQALFLSSRTFAELGGFAEIPLLEDLDLVRRAKSLGRVRTVDLEVVTSGRRWDTAGVLRMSLVNQFCVLGFDLGIAPQRLAQWRDRLTSSKRQPPSLERSVADSTAPVGHPDSSHEAVARVEVPVMEPGSVPSAREIHDADS